MKHQTIFVSCIALAIASLTAENAVAQQASPPRDADPAAPAAGGAAVEPITATPIADAPEPDVKARAAAKRTSEASDKDIGGDITVTASRLQGGNPTSRVTVITEAEIKSRGVTSVEDLIRTLPQNLGTIGTLTNERTRGPLSARGEASVSALGQLGVSAANLGGVGAGNTLVLINGRRVAGAAGIEDGFVNLRNIPLNAIERVEITQDGASAIYGSDALGGVINFVLKSNFQGVTLNVQHLNSSNDADTTRVSLFSGMGWGSGNITGTIGYDRTRPINNRKSGYVTQNYASYYDGNPNYDRRAFENGLQPGVFVRNSFGIDPVTDEFIFNKSAYSLPAGFVGRPTIDDFVLVDPNSKRDYVAKYGGPRTDAYNVTLNLKQNVTDKLSFFANGLFNRSENSELQDFGRALNIRLAPGQYYNPFPLGYLEDGSQLTSIYYYPLDEIATGVLQSGRSTNVQTSWNVTAGLTYQVNRDLKVDVVYTASRSSSSGRARNFANVVELRENPDAPGTFSCYNDVLERPNQVRGAARAALQAAFDKQCPILTSSDPAIAFNPFKSLATGAGASAADFFYLQAVENRASINQNIEARVSGVLLALPGGRVQFAAGGEVIKDGVNGAEVLRFSGKKIDRNRYGAFGETTIPIFGGDFDLPLVKMLSVNLSARLDSTVSEGAVGTVNNIPYDQGGELIYKSSRFTRVTPAYGVRWDVVDGLALRGRWTQGFRSPEYTQLYNVAGSQSNPFYTIAGDRTYDCIAANACDGRGGYLARIVTGPNPDLKPQTSRQQSFSATWQPRGGFANGASLSVTYNRTVIRNQFVKLRDLNQYLQPERQFDLSQFFQRDASGRIVQVNDITSNTTGSKFESVFVEGGYIFGTPIGTFEPKISYLRNLKSEIGSFPNNPPRSTLGKLDGVDRYKIIGSLGWYHHDVSVNLWAYYTPPYLNDYEIQTFYGNALDPTLAKRVRSLTTIDLTASWRVTNKLRMNFAGRNILKAAPPFTVVDTRPYDVGRYNIAGRTLSLEAQLTF